MAGDPAFKVEIDGRQDATEAIARSLDSLTVSDRAGWESDTCRIVIGDPGRSLELPRRGAEMAVSMGYGAELAPMGRFTVDEVTVSDPPPQLSVTGRSADFRDTLKVRRARSWDDTTLGAIVSAIAREHGLQANVEGSLRSLPVPHLDQADESDLALLARLAEEKGATLKLSGGTAAIVPQGAGRRASGPALEAVRIPADSVLKSRVTLADRPRYASAIATWRSTEEAEDRFERSGEGSPAYRIPWPFATQAEAAAAVRAKLESLKRSAARLRLEIPGNQRILSGTPLELERARPGTGLSWVVTRADHVIGRRGYITSIEAEEGS